MRARRTVIAIAALILAALLGLGAAWHGWPRPPAPASTVSGPPIGGPFTMQDQHGQPFTQQNLGGKPTVLFFGFTSCPDICPTTLADVSGWLEKLGPEGARLNAVFVTVDPARDTPAVLADYLKPFDARFVGLTGTAAQLAAMARTYHAYYQQVPQPGGGYTMDHSATIFLLDGAQQLVATLNASDPEAVALAKLRRLLAPR